MILDHTNTTSGKVITEASIAEAMVGIPYLHKGRDAKIGLDCYGAIIHVYRMLGYELFDIHNYDKNWSFKGRNYILENYHKQWTRNDQPVQFLDVVIFNNSRGVANHGGVVLPDCKFMHCCRQGVVINRWTDNTWAERLEAFYHLKERPND